MATTGTEFTLPEAMTGAVVRGNIIHNNDYTGIQFNGDPNTVDGALIENNVIYDNGGRASTPMAYRTRLFETT